MKRCQRGSLPSVPMPLNYYAKIVSSYKPLFGKDNPVFISTKNTVENLIPPKIYELIAENEEDKKRFLQYKKDKKDIFDLDNLKDV